MNKFLYYYFERVVFAVMFQVKFLFEGGFVVVGSLMLGYFFSWCLVVIYVSSLCFPPFDYHHLFHVCPVNCPAVMCPTTSTILVYVNPLAPFVHVRSSCIALCALLPTVYSFSTFFFFWTLRVGFYLFIFFFPALWVKLILVSTHTPPLHL